MFRFSREREGGGGIRERKMRKEERWNMERKCGEIGRERGGKDDDKNDGKKGRKTDEKNDGSL